MRLPDSLDRMDLLSANDRSVQSCEALWSEFGIPGVTWTEAYMVAKHRARDVGSDRHLMAVAALERGHQ